MVSNSWLVAGVVSLPIVLALSPLVPSYLDDHDALTVPWFYAFLGLSVVFLPVSTSLDIVRAKGQAVRYNVLRSLPILLNVVGIVALAVLDRLTLRSALTSAFVTTVLASLITLANAGGLPVRRPDLALIRLEAAYAWRAAGGTLSQMLLARFDQFLMVALVDNTQLGLYVVAATGASVSSPIGQGVALALFSHVRSTSEVEADAQTRRALTWTFASSVGVALLVAVTAPWLVPFFFGEDFRGSVLPLLLLLPGQVALDVANVHASRLEANGRPGAASIGLFSGAAFTVVGIIAVVPSFGIEGAAVITSLSYLCYLGVVWQLRRRHGSARVSEVDADPVEPRS